MASFVPLFDAARVIRVETLRLVLADPDRPDAATGPDSKAVIRSGAARAAGRPLEILRLQQ